MDRADDIHTLPDDLPVPQDDGAADHLLDAVVPSVELRATTGEPIDVFYPVFPPDAHAAEVLSWLRA